MMIDRYSTAVEVCDKADLREIFGILTAKAGLEKHLKNIYKVIENLDNDFILYADKSRRVVKDFYRRLLDRLVKNLLNFDEENLNFLTSAYDFKTDITECLRTKNPSTQVNLMYSITAHLDSLNIPQVGIVDYEKKFIFAEEFEKWIEENQDQNLTETLKQKLEYNKEEPFILLERKTRVDIKATFDYFKKTEDLKSAKKLVNQMLADHYEVDVKDLKLITANADRFYSGIKHGLYGYDKSNNAQDLCSVFKSLINMLCLTDCCFFTRQGGKAVKVYNHRVVYPCYKYARVDYSTLWKMLSVRLQDKNMQEVKDIFNYLERSIGIVDSIREETAVVLNSKQIDGQEILDCFDDYIAIALNEKGTRVRSI
ncbi:MAG: hypothetical protein MSH11_04670 [Ruminococcus sp.]|nr:hypothetical protein [Ruminococcus sp.]